MLIFSRSRQFSVSSLYRLFPIVFFSANLIATATCLGQSPGAKIAGVKDAVLFDAQRLDRINALMEKNIEEGVIVGASGLVLQDGREAFFNTWGYQDRAEKTPIKRDTIFRIYSMTKPITSVAAMQLVERGKMELDEPVSKYLPEFKNLQVATAEGGAKENPGRPMTVRDLLRHTSGLSYGFFDPTHPVDQQYLANGVIATSSDLAATVQKLGKIPLKHSPGTQFEYSVSTDVLGRLIEVVSGERFDHYLQKNILDPLQMSDTHFIVPANKRDRLAAMYSDDGSGALVLADPAESLKFIDDTNEYFSGGGGLCSTIDDYLGFMKMLMNEGAGSEGQLILKPESLNQMFTNQLTEIESLPQGERHAGTPWGAKNFQFGLGFSIEEPRVGTDYNWSGIAGTRFWVNPESGTAMIYMVQVFPLIGHDLSEDYRGLVYEALKK